MSINTRSSHAVYEIQHMTQVLARYTLIKHTTTWKIHSIQHDIKHTTVDAPAGNARASTSTTAARVRTSINSTGMVVMAAVKTGSSTLR